MSGSERITRHDEGGLCTLTLDRPDKLNALDTLAFEELGAHCTALAAQTDRIGCVVLQARGRAFCAGADLGRIGAAPIDPRFKPGVIDRLARLPQPVIAAEPGARLADTHGKWGLVGEWGMSQRLPRRIGIPAAKLMMFTAQPVAAPAALAMGLVDVLVAEGALAARVAQLAAAILANSWHTNFATKRMLRETDGMSLAASLAHERACHPGFAPDFRERLARFGKD